MAHFTEAELPEFLQRLDEFTGRVQTKLALKFILLTFVRTGELRGAEWSEINFDKAEWRIPAERMKMREQHIVPLATQAIDVLRAMQRNSGNRQHVFPNQHKPMGCMSENTILYPAREELTERGVSSFILPSKAEPGQKHDIEVSGALTIARTEPKPRAQLIVFPGRAKE